MANSEFYHALTILTDVCIGCSHCMRACPTEALRVTNGKAKLISNRCIDCGECYRVCPTHAITVQQDDFSKIFSYKYRIALIPSVLLGQFPKEISHDEVAKALITLGFTSIIEVEDSVEYLIGKLNTYVDTAEAKPVISSFCPAIVRLIQVKFPSLVDSIALVRPPLDLTASYIKTKLIHEGVPQNDIGIFYITPCAAKIVAVRRPEGEEKSEIDGIINMDFIYNRILREVKHRLPDGGEQQFVSELSPRSYTWALTNGEASCIDGHCLAIDGIWNVIEFLEKVENDEITDIDYLELRACDESCAGGILAPGNRFLAAELIRKNASSVSVWSINKNSEKVARYDSVISGRTALNPLQPRSMLKLDEDMAKAMLKMKRVNQMMCFLPGIDCGVCGAPSCLSLAEDVVQGSASVSQCVFLQKIMEHNKLDPEHSFRIMKRIWGENRFRKDCDKPIRNK
ncbi:MAG: [Fe-Fe] hydrogenase large subunit C-terminal domain-containing protein [Bacteroidota bacterium]